MRLPSKISITSRTDAIELTEYLPVDRTILFNVKPRSDGDQLAFWSFLDSLERNQKAAIARLPHLTLYFIPLSGNMGRALGNINSAQCMIGAVLINKQQS